MLEVKAINTYYGLSHILFDVSLSVHTGEIVCLLGRNGAGKSTTMKTIMGLTPPKQGEIVFKGDRVTGLPAYQICRRGVGFVPDDRRVFADLTVGENLEISARPRQGFDGWDKERVYNFFPALRALEGRRAGVLSGGEQQMLTIGRALITNPDLLLLDEPTEGLAPIIVEMLEEKILELKAGGLSVLLAEQNQNVALRLSDRAYIIDNGHIRYHGSIEDLRRDEAIRHKYLLV
ncbi:MAG: ABC transporter ATP-binding protein [Desulfuromonadales bacterium]|nr:ABC transporter ATP-binding protein [Desulfuromonadales bacterium]